MKARKGVMVALAIGALGVCGGGIAVAQDNDDDGFKTAIKDYLEPVPGSGFRTEALLSAGDRVPETGNRPQQYQFVGIPDGLGATKEDLRGDRRGKGDDDRRNGRDDDDRRGKGRAEEDEDVANVFVNHELVQREVSHPRATTPEFQRGAFVSEYRLNEDGGVLSGRRAFDTVHQDDGPGLPAATNMNTTPAFSRFCSAYLADSDVGFDRPIFLTGEETSRRENADGTVTPADSFNPNGGQTVAVFQNDNGVREAHALSDFGFFAKENTVVVPNTGRKTVAFSTEDGPQTPDSQLYMYVGEKQKSGTVLERNGLVNGKLFVFRGNDPSRNSEATFENGTTNGQWLEIPKNERQNEVELEAASDARNAFGFVRIEDGAVGDTPNEFNFVTTGDSRPTEINRLGVNYRLKFNRNQDPEKQKPSLSVIYNADQVDAAGQDIAFAPDNMDVIGKLQVIQEDGTTPARLEMEQRNRDGSVWTVDGQFTSNAPGQFPRRERIAELIGRSEGGRDNIRTTAGIWESSGVIDVREEFEDETFLVDVQAHPPTTPPGGRTETVEDGQLLFLSKGDDDDDDDDDDDRRGNGRDRD